MKEAQTRPRTAPNPARCIRRGVLGVPVSDERNFRGHFIRVFWRLNLRWASAAGVDLTENGDCRRTPARPTSTSTGLHRDRRSLLRPVRHQAVDCEPKTGPGVRADTPKSGTGHQSGLSVDRRRRFLGVRMEVVVPEGVLAVPGCPCRLTLT